jgi:hypothetical protein
MGGMKMYYKEEIILNFVQLGGFIFNLNKIHGIFHHPNNSDVLVYFENREEPILLRPNEREVDRFFKSIMKNEDI